MQQKFVLHTSFNIMPLFRTHISIVVKICSEDADQQPLLPRSTFEIMRVS